MNRILDVEETLRQMPAVERWEIARWLLDDLLAQPLPLNTNGKTSATPLPDYAAHRRRIFGDQVLPNMILAARAQESW